MIVKKLAHSLRKYGFFVRRYERFGEVNYSLRKYDLFVQKNCLIRRMLIICFENMNLLSRDGVRGI